MDGEDPEEFFALHGVEMPGEDELAFGAIVGQVQLADCLKYRYPRDVHAFARGRSGDVPVKAVLTPSRKTALSTTDVTRYWPGSITSEVLTIRVYDDYLEPALGARK